MGPADLTPVSSGDLAGMSARVNKGIAGPVGLQPCIKERVRMILRGLGKGGSLACTGVACIKEQAGVACGAFAYARTH